MAEGKQFSIGEVIGFGWTKVKEKFWFWAGVSLITLVISGIGSGVASQFPENSGQRFLVQIAFGIINTIISIGVVKLALNLVDDKQLEFDELFKNAKYFWKIFGSQILIGLITLAGFLLLIIPGIYWAIKYSFTQYFIIDQNVGISEAMKKSGEITKGIKLPLFALSIAMLGVIILGALVIGVGVLWAIPTVGIGMAYLYRKLAKSIPNTSVESKPAEPTPPAEEAPSK